MTVERAALVDYWPLVDVGKLALKPGDVVVFKSEMLVVNADYRRQFFAQWREAFPGIKCVAITRDDAGFYIKRGMREMRAEDLDQPKRATTMD